MKPLDLIRLRVFSTLDELIYIVLKYKKLVV